jgi:hypothetical protein
VLCCKCVCVCVCVCVYVLRANSFRNIKYKTLASVENPGEELKWFESLIKWYQTVVFRMYRVQISVRSSAILTEVFRDFSISSRQLLV